MAQLRLFLFLVLWILCNQSFQAQINNFKKWTIKDGLLQSDIYDITQDKRNNIWIASGGGASLFNGINFKHYTKKDGLAGNTVRAIFEDSRGWIWFATNEGLCYNDGIAFHKINNPALKGTTAVCFAEDKERRLYIGTDDGGLNVLSFQKNSIDIKNINDENGLSNNTILDIAIDNIGNIWLATYGGGINILTKNQNNYTFTIVQYQSKIPSDVLCSIAIKDDDVWIGSYDAGAFKFSAKKILNKDFSTPPLIFNMNVGFSSNTIWDILISRDNRVWLASTDNGLNRLEKREGIYYNTTFNKQTGLLDNQILSLFEDKAQNVWIGTNGSGLNLFTSDYFSHYNTSNGLPTNKIQAIQQDSLGDYWLAASGEGLLQMRINNKMPLIKSYKDKNGLTNALTSIAIGNKYNKNIWLGTENNGIIKFDGKAFTNFTEKDGLLNNHIYSIYVTKKGIVWIGTADGISLFDGVKFIVFDTEKLMMKGQGINAITESSDNTMWFGSSGGLIRYKGESKIRTFDEVEGLKSINVNALASHSNGDVYIGTATGGIYKYNHLKNDTNAIDFVADDRQLISNNIQSLDFLNDYTLIAGTNKGFDKIYFDTNFKIKQVKHYNDKNGFIGLECNSNALLIDKNNDVFFGTVNGITKYNSKLDNQMPLKPELQITDVQLFFKDIDFKAKDIEKQAWYYLPTTLTLPFDENHLTFKFHAHDFNNPESIVYKYKLVGRDSEFSTPRKNNEETFSGIAAGSYSFVVIAQNEAGVWSEPVSFSFTITPPWYKTITFYVLALLILISLTVAYIKWREKKLVKEKEVLEATVTERTSELVEEKKIVEDQKHLIEEKHKEITDSINYAERIQRSFLASKDLLDKNLNRYSQSSKISDIDNYFVLFQPKDVVSGDFYWATTINNSNGSDNFILVTADSTGHGVPGAIMSLLNITSLEKALEHFTNPADILNATRQTIINRLKKDGSAEGGKDGMDCSLVLFDFENKQLHVAAANNPVWIVRASTPLSAQELIEIKPDKMPVGKHDRDQEPFTTNTIDIKEGDMIYTLTDGFPDQFGGEKGKKFMSKNLRELLIANSHLHMSEQRQLLEATFKNWVGDLEQIDDVTIIGIRV